jgi:hypothetical protein
MRRAVVVLIAAALALTLAGCSSSSSSSSTPATDAAATPPPPVAAPVAVAPNLSDNEPDVFSAFPTDTVVPTPLRQDIQAKQPTVLFFYDGSQNTSTEDRKVIKLVMDSNRGLADLFTFDLGKHLPGNASSPVSVDSSFAKDTTYQQSVQVARLLGVSETPYIVITDNQGYITWKFRGLVDRDVLERQVLRASN